MIYLVTHFYSKNELKFLKLNFLEGNKYFDKFIITEFNYTKRGEKKEYVDIYTNNTFSDDELKKVLYFKIDIEQKIKNAMGDDKISRDIMAVNNEPLLRSYFINLVNLKNDDIIISVDADEIIYESAYLKIIECVKKYKIIKLRMNMFYYKLNLFNNNNWSSAIASYFKEGNELFDYSSHGKTIYPQWRSCSMTNKSKITDFITGCHFSWCMTIEEMINKLNSHGCGVSMNFKNINNEEFLKNAIEKLQYFCKKKDNFKLNKINITDKIFPIYLRENLILFKDLYL